MLSKEPVSAAVRGYALGEAKARHERLIELKLLTPERSKAIFIDLCQVVSQNQKDTRHLNEEFRLRHLMRRRRRFDALASAMRNHD